MGYHLKALIIDKISLGFCEKFLLLTFFDNIIQGRNRLSNAGWASSNAAASPNLPKYGRVIARPSHPPLTPLSFFK